MTPYLFISWSGELSRQLGEALRDWIPDALQRVTPYFTPNDIEKGARWTDDVSVELQESKLGIFCLTKDNIERPWIMFEAGAISKVVGEGAVCPVLFGPEPSDIAGPLSQFQSTQFKKEDFYKLFKPINGKCGEGKLLDSNLEKIFKMWWPTLEEKVDQIIKNYKEKDSKEIRSDREIIEEILNITRFIAKEKRDDLIEKDVLDNNSEMLSKLSQKVSLAEERDRNSEIALSILYRVINHKQNLDLLEIQQIFENVPGSIVAHAFGMAESSRKQIIGDLLKSSKNKRAETDAIKERLKGLIPLLKAIINVEKKNRLLLDQGVIHFHYASLAYLYKDIINPDWQEALKYIKDAISAHEKAYEGEKVLPIYRYNLFICHVNIIPCDMQSVGFDIETKPGEGHHKSALSLFDGFVEEGGEIMDMVARSKEIIAPKVHRWVSTYRCPEIKAYLSRHKKIPPDCRALWKESIEKYCDKENESLID